MLGKIIDFIIGKASFEIHIRDPREISVLNLLKSRGFYDCRVSEEKITFSCRCADIKAISEELKKMKLEYRLKTAGLWFLLRNLAARSGILFALAVCFLLDALFSNTVWRIDIVGNETITDREIRETLYSFGIYEGCRKSDVDIRQLTIDYMLTDERMSFMHLNINGTTAVAEISERAEPPKRETDKKAVGNIVAKCDGVISRIDVYSGGKEVENGQSVVKGQLLISSFFETRNVGFLLRCAKGTVFAETAPVFEMKIPKKAYRPSEEKEYKKRGLRMLNYRLPIDGGNIILDGKNAFLKTENKKLTLFGIIDLPMSLEIRRYTVRDSEEYERSFEEAEKIYEKAVENHKNEFLKDARILSEETETREEDDSFVFITRFSCIENIGLDKPFEIREN